MEAPTLRIARVCPLLLLLPSLFAADRVSYEQLAGILNSAISGLQNDAQIAHRLSALEPAERISGLQKAALLSRAPGPRTRDILEILADASAFVDAPGAPAPDTPPIEQQSEIMSRAREYTERYVSALPNFICTRITRRFDDFPDLVKIRPEAWQNLRLRDTDAGQLTYNHGRESYLADMAPPENHDEYQPSQGLTSFGEFGGMIAALFIGDVLPRMTWGYWETIDGTRLAVFRYEMPPMHSDYHVGFCCARNKETGAKTETLMVTVAYRGEVFVDPGTGGVWRITRQALNLPASFPTRRADTIIDYRPVQIGGRLQLTPVRSTLFSDSIVPDTPKGRYKIRHLNDVRFVRYHRFEAESRLMTEDAPNMPVPADMSQGEEQNPWLELDPLADAPPPVVEKPTADKPAPSKPAEAQPRTVIRTSTYLVEVPVIVRDKAGKAITGLSQQDFEVVDNGRRQDIRLFQTESAQMSAAAPESAVPPPALSTKRVSSNSIEEATPQSHSTVILVDKINTEWADLAYARMELLKFLRQFPLGEPVAAYVLDWGGLNVVAEVGGDPARIVDRLTSRHDPITAIRLGEGAGTGGSCEWTLRALSQVAQHLAGVPGRKSLIWLSAGFPLTAFSTASNAIYTGGQAGQQSGGQSCHDALVSTTALLNAANVAIYAVDAPGLQAPYGDAGVVSQAPGKFSGLRQRAVTQAPSFTAAINARQASMLELATRTGGRAFLNANDITGAIQTAAADPVDSYRLGFYADVKGDGLYHQLKVHIPGHPDWRLRYRSGYIDKAAPHDRKAAMQEILSSATNSVDIPLTADLSNNLGQCVLSLKIGLSAVALSLQGGRWKGKLDIAVVERIEDSAGAESPAWRLDQTLALELKQETYEQDLRDGFPYRHSFVRKPGTASLRVVVRDPGSGAAGSLSIHPAVCY